MSVTGSMGRGAEINPKGKEKGHKMQAELSIYRTVRNEVPTTQNNSV
jgi:hypothetical protein